MGAVGVWGGPGCYSGWSSSWEHKGTSIWNDSDWLVKTSRIGVVTAHVRVCVCVCGWGQSASAAGEAPPLAACCCRSSNAPLAEWKSLLSTMTSNRFSRFSRVLLFCAFKLCCYGAKTQFFLREPASKRKYEHKLAQLEEKCRFSDLRELSSVVAEQTATSDFMKWVKVQRKHQRYSKKNCFFSL